MKAILKSAKTIEINDQFRKTLELLENTNKNVFITGKAGTGKSTLLELFRSQTEKKIVVLAPTGVAALNVKGQTIHSFFGFRPDITVQKVKRLKPTDKKTKTFLKLEMIIIDEVSMVRADLLDCVDRFMRLNGKDSNQPFGGVQMVFIGDLYQLPPVVTSSEREIFKQSYQSPYFFSAKVLNPLPKAELTHSLFQDEEGSGTEFQMEFVELEKIYRQSDQSFIDLLNAVRNNSITLEQVEMLNQRIDPNFAEKKNEFYIYLTPTNAQSEEINQGKLDQINKPPHQYAGTITGNFDLKNLPTAPELTLKVGSQVMMLNNDSSGRWVNGSIGQIIKFKKLEIVDEDSEEKDAIDVIEVKLDDGKKVDVTPFTWEMYDYFYDEEKRQIDSRTTGSFTQFPMKLAWSVTIHKSQGKTFDRVILDIGNGAFAHGQVYVALSRCTSFEGLILKKPIQKRHIFMDWQVVKFVTEYQYKLSNQFLDPEERLKRIEEAIECEQTLLITYLKANDIKSKRRISPQQVGEMQYLGKTFIGVEAYCHERGEVRCFRVDRILELRVV